MANTKISALTSATTPLAGTETLPVVQSSTTKQVSVANLTAGRAMSALSSSFGSGTSAYSIGGTQVSVTNSAANTYLSVYGGTGATNGGFLLGGNNAENFANFFWSNGSNFLQLATTPVGSKVQFNIAGVVVGDMTTNGFTPAAAKGVNFTANTPAAGMTSQLLNWYEEGTWTGTLGGQTTDPTTPVTATGLYTRIGRQVTVQIYFVNVNTTGGSGNMEIRGLPFTPKGTTNDHFIGSCESYGLDVPNKYNVAVVVGSLTKILFQSMADDAGWTEPQLTAGATKFLGVTITYFV